MRVFHASHSRGHLVVVLFQITFHIRFDQFDSFDFVYRGRNKTSIDFLGKKIYDRVDCLNIKNCAIHARCYENKENADNECDGKTLSWDYSKDVEQVCSFREGENFYGKKIREFEIFVRPVKHQK